jgi:hypothetical protein
LRGFLKWKKFLDDFFHGLFIAPPGRHGSNA